MHYTMFVFVSFMGLFISGAFEEDANMTTTTRSCNDKERQALLEFNASLIDINRNITDCCQWFGVSCDNHTDHVTGLDLSSSYYHLSGNISHLLLFLPRLQYLDLSEMDFQLNPIPTSLSSLTYLKHLRIYNANLSGSIPHQLANLSSLLYLDLSSNSLSGPIPHRLANLSNLKHLDLSDNCLNGRIPVSFGNLIFLDLLDLSGNRLECVIPNSFGNWSSLVHLDLSRNLLNGSIPNFVGCPSMKGTISNTSFHGCPSLERLDLSSNWLTGNLPNSIGKLLNLYVLDVSSNSLNGLISDVHLLNLTQLTYLDLSFNSFALNLSPHAEIRFQLNTIKLQSCKLGPSFPVWIQTQRDFAYLDISNAGISDHAPGWFWNLPRGLRFLNISSNEIKGMLPNMTSVFKGYPGMDLSHNQLKGTIPSLPFKLAALNLSGNRFSGTLSFLCQIDTALTFLDLSNNLLSGSLPDCLIQFQETLVVLNLSNNKLSGEIPSFFESFSKLQALYLRRNAFVGDIPKSLSSCTQLRFVDLGENKLSGNIPAWIGKTLSELYVLVLRSNKFNGSVPSQICSLNNLQFLDLANNALLGNIPRCFGNFTAMATRRFQNDINSHSYSSYVSRLPKSTSLNNACEVEVSCTKVIYPWSWSKDEVLSNEEAIFIDNALVGWKGTQREFGRGLNLLKSIDISSNNLYGKLPPEITNLIELVSLNFSNNKLHGQIPKDMDRLKSLESLDLSRNEFSGHIPSSLAQMTPLSYIDLSYNKLSGRIPSGPQLQLFNSSSYTGNPQLCGFPLTHSCEPPRATVTVVGKDDVEEDKDELWMSYYTGMGAGFAIGFLGICGVLFLNRWCMYVLLACLNNMKDWIYVTSIVHFRNLRTKFRR